MFSHLFYMDIYRSYITVDFITRFIYSVLGDCERTQSQYI